MIIWSWLRCCVIFSCPAFSIRSNLSLEDSYALYMLSQDLDYPCRAVWSIVIPVLLATYGVQFYVENKTPDAFFLADFSQSSRPHIDGINAAVNAALAIASTCGLIQPM